MLGSWRRLDIPAVSATHATIVGCCLECCKFTVKASSAGLTAVLIVSGGIELPKKGLARY